MKTTKKDFLRDDLDTYKKEFRLLLPFCEFEVKKYNPKDENSN